jgi:cysteine desulfurase family protein (TIGR01976 family)
MLPDNEAGPSSDGWPRQVVISCFGISRRGKPGRRCHEEDMFEALVPGCREQFPALRRQLNELPVVFLDGPAGTQVPQCVIDAIGRYLNECNANHGGSFVTSLLSDRWIDAAHRAVSEFLGGDDPSSVAFGPNMTSLTFALSRALARTWRPGDEVVVTRLEHDANFTPWVLAAADAGATVRYVGIRTEDCTLDLDDFRSKLSERTRLVAVGCASNATGTRNPVKQICTWARQLGALSFLDGVHFAPHDLLDVRELGCDFLVCSAYKFFGPHVGILWGRRDVLEATDAYKLRPAPNDLPGKWMTGTQCHEGIAGTLAAVEYLADVGRTLRCDPQLERRAALQIAYQEIAAYERQLVWRLIDGLMTMPGVRVWGITDRQRADQRMPTVGWTHSRLRPSEIAHELGEQGIFVWHGNFYALPLTEALGLEPDGMVRIGLVHYNTADEVDRVLQAIRNLLC